MGLIYVDICLCVWVYACSFVAALSMYFYINDQKKVLTGMYFLEVDMLLQFPPQCYFSAILSHRPIIHKEEMGMQAVENV